MGRDQPPLSLMRLLLDENSSEHLLTQLMRKAGHDVESVTELQKTGDPDPTVFGYAIKSERALLTRNRDDFKLLHELVRDARGDHHGVLLVCMENNPARDLTPRGIVL